MEDKQKQILEGIATKFLMNDPINLVEYHQAFSKMMLIYIKTNCTKGTVIDIERVNMFNFLDRVNSMLYYLRSFEKAGDLDTTFDYFTNTDIKDKGSIVEQHSLLTNCLTQLIIEVIKTFDDFQTEKEIIIFSGQLHKLILDLQGFYLTLHQSE